jgi:putative membrane protein
MRADRPDHAHNAQLREKPMNRFMLIIAVCLPMVAAAQDNPDASFYKKATAGGLAEIDGGMLAQRQGNSKAVKDFGAMMVKDHTAANHTLRDLADANHVDLPALPKADDAAQRAKLSALTGDAFDKAYIEWQILSHRDAIALFKEESASGDDLDARHFATATLPKLQLHLSALMAIPVTAAAPAPTPAPAATNP